MNKTLEDLNKNDFCSIEYDGRVINARIIDKDCTKGMFSLKHQVKVKPIGVKNFLWLSPKTKVN